MNWILRTFIAVTGGLAIAVVMLLFLPFLSVAAMAYLPFSVGTESL
jgi:hypothetical protein